MIATRVRRKQTTRMDVTRTNNTSSSILIVIFIFLSISEVRTASPTGQPSRQPTAQVLLYSYRIALYHKCYCTIHTLISPVPFATTALAQIPLTIISLLLFIFPTVLKKSHVHLSFCDFILFLYNATQSAIKTANYATFVTTKSTTYPTAIMSTEFSTVTTTIATTIITAIYGAITTT